MKKRLSIVSVLLVTMLMLASCSTQSVTMNTQTASKDSTATTATATTASAKTEYNITFIVQSLSNPFYCDMETGVKKAVKKLADNGKKVNCTVQSPKTETSTEEFIGFMENAIAKKDDAIIITPLDATALIPTIVKANKANIPVFIVDSRVDTDALKAAGGHVETFIGTNSVEGAKIAGEAMGMLFKDMGDAGKTVKVAIIEGATGQRNATDRKEGFIQGIKNYPYLKVVASQTANWDMQQAYDVTTNILTANPDLDAIFSCSDQMGIGVAKAVKDRQLKGKIKIISFDGGDIGRKAIIEGDFYGTIAQYPIQMGYDAIMCAVQKVDNPNMRFPEEKDTGSKLITIEDYVNNEWTDLK